MSARSEIQTPPTEAEIAHCQFADGIEVVTTNDNVFRLTAWVNVQDVGEHRVLGRLVMSEASARRLVARLRETFGPQH